MDSVIEVSSADKVGDGCVGTLISERYGLDSSGAGALSQTVVWARRAAATIDSRGNLRVGGQCSSRVGLKTFKLRPSSSGRSLWRRSVSRGVGPSWRSAALEYGSRVTRERAISRAAVGHMSEEATSASWCFSAPKTDPRALEKTRVWQCVCGHEAWATCPFRAVARQLGLLRRKFGRVDGTLSEDLLWFFGLDGVELEAGSCSCDWGDCEAFRWESVSWTWSEKVRRALAGVFQGAPAVTSMELDTVLIQLMARWSSQVVPRYVSEAPLAKISDIFYKNAQQARCFGGLSRSCPHISQS